MGSIVDELEAILAPGQLDVSEVSLRRYAIDQAPVIDFQLSGILGNNGWYRSNVTLNWQISEMPVSFRSFSGCDSRSIADDTAGSTFTCTVTRRAPLNA